MAGRCCVHSCGRRPPVRGHALSSSKAVILESRHGCVVQVLFVSSGNRPGSAGARHNQVRTEDGAELRQGPRSVRARRYPSHRRRIRRSVHYGNQGRIRPRHWPRRWSRGYRRVELPRKGSSCFLHRWVTPLLAISIVSVNFWLRASASPSGEIYATAMRLLSKANPIRADFPAIRTCPNDILLRLH
jgi:hypothetical protein